MITLKGTPSRAFAPIIGEVTFTPIPFYRRSKTILICEELDGASLGYKGCICEGSKGRFYHPDHIFGVSEEDISKIKEGDIVRLDGEGKIDVLWEHTSHQNCLFLTENCNCRCVMCPQPPTDTNSPQLIKEVEEVLDLLRAQKVSDICLTGGEPSLVGDKFFSILRRCVTEHPEANISILTNGKLFADKKFADNLLGIPTKKVTFCVSLHSEVDTLHDMIVGRKGSYAKTQKGIYHLASMGFPIEIRVVITKLNYHHLLDFAEHLYNYFPFCIHYAFMGLELHGHAEKNADKVYISPQDFQEPLKDAVLFLARRGLLVSIYNIPLCLCHNEVKNFARQSISGWKNIYLPVCDECEEKLSCAGFFSTSAFLPIELITPIRRREQ